MNRGVALGRVLFDIWAGGDAGEPFGLDAGAPGGAEAQQEVVMDDATGVTMGSPWTRREVTVRLLSLSAAIGCAPLSALCGGRLAAAGEAPSHWPTEGASADGFLTIDGWIVHVDQLQVGHPG